MQCVRDSVFKGKPWLSLVALNAIVSGLTIPVQHLGFTD